MENNAIPDYKRLVSFSLMGPESGALCEVDCNDGKITRINPYAGGKRETEGINLRQPQPKRTPPGRERLSINLTQALPVTNKRSRVVHPGLSVQPSLLATLELPHLGLQSGRGAEHRDTERSHHG